MDDTERAKLAAEAEELVTALRHAGLYETIGETIRFASGDRPIVVLNLWIGDNAFRDRVQEPEKAETTRSFAPIQNRLEDMETEDIIEKMKRGEWDG